MTQKEILEGNKLIYKFKGWEFDNHSHTYRLGDLIMTELNFHKDWNLLMPVVEKISRIPSRHPNGLYKYLCHVDLNPIKGITIEGMYRRNFNAKDEIFIQIYEYSYVENTWLGVVEFIKWYNKNK